MDSKTLGFYLFSIFIGVLGLSFAGIQALQYTTYIIPPCWISYFFGWKCWDKIDQYKSYIVAILIPVLLGSTFIPIIPFTILRNILLKIGIIINTTDIIVMGITGFITAYIVKNMNEMTKLEREDLVAKGLPPTPEKYMEKSELEIIGFSMAISMIVMYMFMQNNQPRYQPQRFQQPQFQQIPQQFRQQIPQQILQGVPYQQPQQSQQQPQQNLQGVPYQQPQQSQQQPQPQPQSQQPQPQSQQQKGGKKKRSKKRSKK